MPISVADIIRVAHADVAMNRAFSRSVDHWQRENRTDHVWKRLAGDCASILIGKGDGVVIDGNCSDNVSAPDGGCIHIYGDLLSAIDVDGHSEIVITGNICANARIHAAGICHVFIGGDFSGEIHSDSSVKVWVGSNFMGSIKTGNPSTDIYVGGRYDGSISPMESAALLTMTIAGFASEKSLTRIVDCGYTVFNASVGRSDVEPGLYPKTGFHKKISGGNAFSRWCVMSESRG